MQLVSNKKSIPSKDLNFNCYFKSGTYLSISRILIYILLLSHIIKFRKLVKSSLIDSPVHVVTVLSLVDKNIATSHQIRLRFVS